MSTTTAEPTRLNRLWAEYLTTPAAERNALFERIASDYGKAFAALLRDEFDIAAAVEHLP